MTIVSTFWAFKRQPHKMAKLTQAIRRQQHTSCLSVFDHFVRLALKGLSNVTTLRVFVNIIYVSKKWRQRE